MSTTRVVFAEIVTDVKRRTANWVVLCVVRIVVDGKRDRSYERIAGFGSGVSCLMMVRASLACCIGNGCQLIMAATC